MNFLKEQISSLEQQIELSQRQRDELPSRISLMHLLLEDLRKIDAGKGSNPQPPPTVARSFPPETKTLLVA